MELIPPGVDRLEARAAAVRREADGFSILCRTPGGAEQAFSARRIIGADGAHSAVRRCLFPGHRMRRYVAVQQWFEREDQHPFYSCIFDPEAGDCCSWSISKNRWFIFGGAFSPQNCRSVFEAQKERLARRFGFVFGTPAKTEACEVLRPRRLGEICYGDDGALLIGEAAGWISPARSRESAGPLTAPALPAPRCLAAFPKRETAIERIPGACGCALPERSSKPPFFIIPCRAV